VKRAVKAALREGRGPVGRRLFPLARRVYYAGRRVECPCCGARLRKFVPIARSYDPDLECPRCGSYSRHRQLWLFLTQRMRVLSERLALLHVAPEVFFHRRLERAPNLRYVSVDLHAPHAMERADVEALPYVDGSFDAVVCSHVLEHVNDDRGAMSELWRVLKPGGWAVIQAPVDRSMATTREDPDVRDPHERARLFGAEDHVRLYGRDYVPRLEDAGFEVSVVPFHSEIAPDLRERYGLLALEDVHLCRKAAPLKA
jgi:SAM-dependent methyltransferase